MNSRRLLSPLFLKKPSFNKAELKHYRSVANIQLASKLVENCAAKQVINHVQSNNLQEPMQSAYRACHSTETPLEKVHSDFQCAIGNQKAVLLLLLDLSAPFDTVNHDILLKRLSHDFSVKGCVNKWFSSYLENRTMQVFIDGPFSPDFIMQYGLPQDSVIGPLGFIFYTHAVGYILRHHGIKYHLYADDIQHC